jgi:hypothetical protein
MACCGEQRRATVRNVTPAATENRTPAAAPPPAAPARSYVGAGVKLRYRERSPVQVRGPGTGTRYEFSGQRPVQVVDRRDVERLLKTGFFDRAEY